MRLRKISILIPCSLFLVPFAYGEQALNYVLAEPGAAWRAHDTTNLAENVWAVTNSAFAAKAGSWSVDADTNAYQQVSGTTAGRPVMTLRSVDVGFPVERNKPRYYLGSALTPPDDTVDWDATYAYYLENFGEAGASVTNNFLFDREGQAVYVTRGETSTFKWILREGDAVETNDVIVIASPVSEGRPKNIFLTDATYGGRTVDLTGKFVKLFGPADLLTVKKGHKSTGVAIGGAESTQEYVTSGVYIDETSGQKMLYAAGDLSGQFVLAYYDSGNYQKLVDVVTVQVSPPETIVCNAHVGDALKPTGRGYGITGLAASPTTLDDFDEQGPFLYQHKGSKGYSPKNGDVFALRPTDDATRNQTQIYWFEKDNQGVQWPFEVNEYRVTWPDTMPVLVRGNLDGDAGKGMTIPAVYTASLTDYQESDGAGRHAADPVDGVFAPTGAGKALLKLTADDNIWFVPVRSVLRGDPAWFAPSYVTRKVGMECAMRTAASLNGLAAGRALALAEDVPGYVYAPASDPVWNPNAYSESGTGAGGYPSVVYPVTASMDAATTNEVEVWWSARYEKRGDDMPEPLVYPAAPQNYRAAWPDDVDAPDIVLASQLGGAGQSVARDPDGQCVMFASDAVRMDLDDLRYFSAEGGMAGLWHMREEGSPAGADLVTFGDVIAIKDDPTLVPPGTTGWKYLAVTWTTSNICYAAVLPNGTINTRTEPFARAAELTGVISNAYVGGVTVPLTAVDDLSMWNRPMSEREIVQIAWDVNGVNPLDRTRHYDCEHADEYIAKHASVTNMPYQLLSPGGPRRATAVIRADAMPTVYRQPIQGGVGYNPNEEHAFVRLNGAGTGYVTWAFRCDLNAVDNVSKPGVLVEYVQDGAQKMTYFDVKLTNELYRTLSASCTAGTLLPGPEPFFQFDRPFLAEDYWANDSLVPYRDRKGQVWARCAGDFGIYMYYAMQSTYDWPGGVAAARPEDGTAVPWLAYLDSAPSAPSPAPHPWTWNVTWPDEDKVPKMKIGQTLTTAADGLPEVWNAKAMALLYPATNVDETALLYDPTRARKESTLIAFARLGDLGLSADPNGKLHSYKGQYYFRDMPPSVSDRLYLDVSDAADMKLVLKGVKDSDTVGELRVNVLEDCEYAALTNVITTSDSTLRESWDKAAQKLATGPVRPSATALVYDPNTTHGEYKSTYEAADHYALTAMGMTNWVVLIENDATNSFCDAGNPIGMHVFRVVPEYNLARVVTREDAGNLLSQQLTVSYTEHFAAQSRGYEFEWRKAAPLPNGTVPVIDEHSTFHADRYGLTAFVVGGQGDTLKNMVNTYYSCRYRAATNSPAYRVMGEKWSEWCSPPGLAEGWVQRVLNNVTPFSQRVTDLYENAVDSTVSMIVQAGKPYTGDVALNQDNLSEVGLVELYRTILAKAESMSLLMKTDDPGANKQLLLAVERLADMYGVLGDEAYADALNPTIGFGTSVGGSGGASCALEYGALSTSMFCFDNQMPSLLDEELALMRGRSCVNAPDNTVGPCYNRLVWNFTKGITAGEVAYAVNYAISGTSANGTMSEEQARAQFPQGHGDAYGHYLSALQGYYRLMRNPYFSWEGIVGMGEMNVADNAVNVDYYDEATFAKFAAKVAKAADKTVELTALKHWRDNYAGTVGGGYVDTNVTNAFGYGEWASRGAYGALCNWAVANDLLPEEEIVDETGAKYEDKGLLHIDRGTAEGIGELASAVKSIQRTTDRMDAGMNPLGLNDKALPFDLTPVGGAGGATHYEQIRQRAQDALVNARDVLDNAQTQASRVRYLEDTASTALADQLALAERQYENELVAIYGKPYADDIGAGKTYPEGYDGPDYYHFMWMDLENFGLTNVESTIERTFKASGYNQIDGNIRSEVFTVTNEFSDTVVTYRMTADGVVEKDPGVSGNRLRAGELQLAYADFLSVYANLQSKIMLYQRSVERMSTELQMVSAIEDTRSGTLKVSEEYYDTLDEQRAKLRNAKIGAAWLEHYCDGLEAASDINKSLEGIFGLADSGVRDGVVKAIAWFYFGSYTAGQVAQAALETVAEQAEYECAMAEAKLEKANTKFQTQVQTALIAERVIAAADEQLAIIADIKTAFASLETAQTKVATLLAKADGLRDELKLVRQQAAKNVSKLRYSDMFFRKMTSAALSQYGASFAIARTYAFLAAQAYGYETGSPLESTGEGREILRQIVGARMIGETTVGGDVLVTDDGDAGLSGILARLDANWANRKTQLGINNPQEYATWFSLRHELFRILTDATGDSAWQTELSKYWVEDIKTDAEFQRHCQPFASQFGLAEKEPALVIPFETTIDFAYNLFGRPLAFDDSQFDSTYYATKIALAGVWFEGYNEKRAGYRGASAFAKTPNVYLVPVGTDRMRVPGTDGGEIASFDVVDQTIPAPYPLTAAEIADADWLPSYLDGDLGGADGETRIRRHPSFRAYYGNVGDSPADDQLDATRLTGRSVWNTRWLLVIPAGTLGSDRDQALKAFIYGLDTDRDGIVDVKPVSDIRIGFRTYSNSGN